MRLIMPEPDPESARLLEEARKALEEAMLRHCPRPTVEAVEIPYADMERRLREARAKAKQAEKADSVRPSTPAEEQRQYAIRTITEGANLMRKRGHDYASDDDAFSNFRFTGMALDRAIRAGCRGFDLAFIALLSTKLARMIELRGSGKAPWSEGIRDTAQDMANYAALWEACIHFTQEEPSCPNSPDSR